MGFTDRRGHVTCAQPLTYFVASGVDAGLAVEIISWICLVGHEIWTTRDAKSKGLLRVRGLRGPGFLASCFGFWLALSNEIHLFVGSESIMLYIPEGIQLPS